MKYTTKALALVILLIVNVAIAENSASPEQPLFTAKDAWYSALENNHGLQSREFIRHADRYGVREAWAAFFPQIDAMGSYGWSRYKRDYGGRVGELTETDKPTRYDVGLNQVVYSHRAVQGLSHAKAVDELSAIELDTFRLNVGYLAVEAYLNAASLQAEAKVVAEQVVNEEKRLEQLEQMRQHGFSSRADTLEAQASLDEIKAELIGLQSKQQAAMKHLQAVTGVELGNHLMQEMPDNAWRNTLELLEHDWFSTALFNSGELQRSRGELKVAEQTVKLEKSGHWPELHLSVRYNKNDSFTTNVLEENRVELQLRLPLYSGGATTARSRQAKERMHAARYELKDTENSISVNISRLQEELRGGYSRIQALQAASESARVALEVAEQGFRGGVRSLNELLDSRTRLSRVERSLINETHNNLLSQLQLRLIAGELTQAHISQVFP